MEVKAKLRYLRIAPRKVRLIADLIRGKSAEEAQTILDFSVKRAALPLFKLLKSALVSAKNNLELEKSNLYISKIAVDEGPKLKRWRARSRGQAFEIQKKTYDLIMFDSSLHHFYAISEVLSLVKEGLKDDGILLINEYTLKLH